jgi:Na+/H+-dicarboxylate symporter
VLTVGATANQNGTALYEGITVGFWPQLAASTTIAQQLTVVHFLPCLAASNRGARRSILFVVAALASVDQPG